MFKIEKGIKIPSRRSGGRDWAELADGMKPKDSVLVNTRIQANTLRQALVRRGYKVATRGAGKERIRVWSLRNGSN